MNLRNSSSSDYLTYKKSRMNPARVQRVEKRVEKIRRILKLSFITFCIMFICVVAVIKKYSKRVDIEYGRHGAEIAKTSETPGLNDFSDAYDSDKRTIDKRLLLIQEEENAPSESRVLPQDRDKNEVMNLEHFEKLKSDNADEEEPVLPKKEIKPVQNDAPQQNSTGTGSVKMQNEDVQSVNIEQQGVFSPIELPQKANIKVLIGKYPTFDDAKSAQTAMKNSKARIAPFIRKVDDIYCLQIGSYSNMDVARAVAGNYGKDGYDVWIYQQ